MRPPSLLDALPAPQGPGSTFGELAVDLFDLVDPPGDSAGHRQHVPHHPASCARGYPASAGPPSASPSRIPAPPHSDPRRDRSRARGFATGARRAHAPVDDTSVSLRAPVGRRRRRPRRRRPRRRSPRPRTMLQPLRCYPGRSPSSWPRSRAGSARSSRCASASTAASRAPSERWACTSTSLAKGSVRSRPK